MPTTDPTPATATAPAPPPTRRRRWPLLLWLIPLAALIVAISVSTSQARAQEERDSAAASQAVIDLLARALKGEPDALKDLTRSSRDLSLLTPAAAEVALGKNPRIEPVSVSLATNRYENSATVRIVAQGGEILVTLPVTRSNRTDSYEAQGPLELPTVSTDGYPGDPDAVYLINGERVELAELRAGAPIWPGLVRITPPTSDVFSFATPPETFLGGRLSNTFDGVNVRLDTAATLRPEFSKRAAAAIEAWLKPCLVADDKVPDWCPVRPAAGRGVGIPIRNVVWSAPVVIPPGQEAWLNTTIEESRSVTHPAFDVTATNGVLVGSGQFYDGTSWRDYKETRSLLISGTLSVDGDKLTFTQSTETQQRNREDRS